MIIMGFSNAYVVSADFSIHVKERLSENMLQLRKDESDWTFCRRQVAKSVPASYSRSRNSCTISSLYGSRWNLFRRIYSMKLLGRLRRRSAIFDNVLECVPKQFDTIWTSSDVIESPSELLQFPRYNNLEIFERILG